MNVDELLSNIEDAINDNNTDINGLKFFENKTHATNSPPAAISTPNLVPNLSKNDDCKERNQSSYSSIFADMDSFLNNEYLSPAETETKNVCTDKSAQTIRLNTKTKKNNNCCEIIKLGSGDDCCRHIRCLNCDHLIIHFMNRKWFKDTNYLFMRLNFPNVGKLQKQSMQNAQFSCYACQCQWINIEKSKENNKNYRKQYAIQLRNWQCTGH